MNIFKDIKGVFKQPKKRYYFGKIHYGCPYFYPIGFLKSVLLIRKLKLTPKEELDKMNNDYIRNAKKYSNIPMVRRNKYWIIKDWYIEIGSPIRITWYDLGWKDKFESPRHEWNPSFQIYFFKWQFCIFWGSPIEPCDDDGYWQQILWYLYYSNKDIKKAKETWGWIDYDTKKSTWNDDYLI